MNVVTVTPITPRIGAEIGGVDLREELTEGTIEQIREAWLEPSHLLQRPGSDP